MDLQREEEVAAALEQLTAANLRGAAGEDEWRAVVTDYFCNNAGREAEDDSDLESDMDIDVDSDEDDEMEV